MALVKMGDERSFGSAHRVNLKRKIRQALERAPRQWGRGGKETREEAWRDTRCKR